MSKQIKVFIYFMIPILSIALLLAFLPMFIFNNKPPTQQSTTQNPTSPASAASVWDGGNTAPSGSGTEASPYIIDTAAKLAWLSANPASGNGKYFKQTVDIDLASRNWTPINSGGSAYSYYYDGGGYSISNIYMKTRYDFMGLFGRLYGGYIKNVNITSGSVTWYYAISFEYNLGAICGYVDGGGAIFNCSNGATVEGPSKFQGGLVGSLVNGTVYNCYNTGALTASGGDAGGIVGVVRSNGTVLNCYNGGTLIGTRWLGGIVGGLDGGKIISCFNFGQVRSSTIGYTSARGGIVGETFGSNPLVINCWYNSSTIGSPYPATAAIGVQSSGTIENVSSKNTALMTGTNAVIEMGLENGCWEATASYPVLKNSGIAQQWNGSSTTQPSGSGTQVSPYLIATGANLAWISANYSGTAAGKYFRQTANIDLGNYSFTPINPTTAEYTYYYDGNGFKIYNLYQYSTGEYVGLFGKVHNGWIKNVTIASGSVRNLRTSEIGKAGAIVAGILSSSMDKCMNYAMVSGYSIIGGVAGYLWSNTTLSSCNNYGLVQVRGTGYSGGIVGLNEASTILTSFNYGPVSATGNDSNVGGIAGQNNSVIHHCWNKSTIHVSTPCNVGGIAGAHFGEIRACANSGTVHGYSHSLGGIAGYAHGIIKFCFNEGPVHNLNVGQNGGICGVMEGAGNINECYNIGSVTTTSKGNHGAVVGKVADSASATNCYYNSGTLGSPNPPTAAVGLNQSSGTVSNMLARSTTQMKSTANATLPSGMTLFSVSNWVLTTGNYPALLWFGSIDLNVS